MKRNRVIVGLAAVCLAAALVLGCGFADLREMTVKTVPAAAGELLAGAYTEVTITFDTEVYHEDAEKALQVSGGGASVEGDLSWEGPRLAFTPRAAWQPGLRYVLRLSGSVEARDGRSLALATSIPFYAGAPGQRPYLRGFFPAEGASTAAFLPGERLLELEFSLPMDAASVDTALTFNCPGERRLEWLDEGLRLRVTSDEALAPWTTYTWKLSVRALGASGAPLAAAAEGSFVTDEDKTLPAVKSLGIFVPGAADFAGSALWGPWVPAGGLSTGLGAGGAVGVEFTRAMDADSVGRCVTIEPQLSGWTVPLSSRSVIFIPEREPEPETRYRITISGDTRDAAGLKMGSDVTDVFDSTLRYLRLVGVYPEGMPSVLVTGDAPVSAAVQIDPDSKGLAVFSLKFSSAFDIEAGADAALRVSAAAFFPVTLTPPALRGLRWLGPDTLRMEWEKFEPGLEGEPHYYKVLIPGGRGGIRGSAGEFFKEDMVIYLENAL
ncbi:MAG: Ig-like domain-containing protein [Treponema sp.]|nr:Ig-like domain-containing protein [Treponema sp.]